MFVGAYLGGDKSYALDPAILKGNVLESRDVLKPIPAALTHSVIITIDGRRYEATIGREVGGEEGFTY